MESAKKKFAGKIALVTGGAKRIGRAVALSLADHGIHVAVHYHTSQKEAREVASEIRKHGVQAWIYQADLLDRDQAGSLISEVLRETKVIDYLIHSASIFTESTLLGVTAEDIEDNMQINALSPFYISREFVKQEREGSIVTFLDAKIKDYDGRHVGYQISKQIFFSLTRAMSLEFAPAVQVNAVAPGLILPPVGKDESYLTKRYHTNPLQKSGRIEEITDAVLFLLRSDFITGQVIYIDGGRHLKGNFYGGD